MLTDPNHVSTSISQTSSAAKAENDRLSQALTLSTAANDDLKKKMELLIEAEKNKCVVLEVDTIYQQQIVTFDISEPTEERCFK